MADAVKRDWVDIVSKLMIPIVLAVCGYLFSLQQTHEQEARQKLERDSGYIRLLASANEKERDLGMKIIEVLVNENKFSEDLKPVVQAVAQGRPSDAATQRAAQILAKAPPAADQKVAAPIPAPTTVYIQIAREEQRVDAENLQQTLRAKGYSAPGIELVQHPTSHTYIRYFASDKKDQATAIQGMMKDLGISAQIQNFTRLSSPDLEIWLGVDEPPHSAGTGGN